RGVTHLIRHLYEGFELFVSPSLSSRRRRFLTEVGEGIGRDFGNFESAILECRLPCRHCLVCAVQPVMHYVVLVDVIGQLLSDIDEHHVTKHAFSTKRLHLHAPIYARVVLPGSWRVAHELRRSLESSHEMTNRHRLDNPERWLRSVYFKAVGIKLVVPLRSLRNGRPKVGTKRDEGKGARLPHRSWRNPEIDQPSP